MRIEIDTDAQSLIVTEAGETRHLGLYDRAAVELLGPLWLKLDWNAQRWRSFSWLGLPMLQLPEDAIRLHEAIWRFQPDLIVETGVYRGGGSLMLASVCRLMGKGRVICVDIDLTPETAAAIAAHPLGDLITSLKGSSTAPDVVAKIKPAMAAAERVLVVLDSNHAAHHVRDELETYGPLLKSGSWILATDGVMVDLHDVPIGDPSWKTDNPQTAVAEFLAVHGASFERIDPPVMYGDSSYDLPSMTYFPNGWLRKK